MKPGDRVQTRRGRLGTIISIDGDTAEVFFSTGEEWINVHDLEPVELGAADQLLSGNDSPSIEFGLRLQALYLRHAHQFDPWSGLTNARIEPNPYQISIAHSVVNKRQPRMILADEVGLGKTIEAALTLGETGHLCFGTLHTNSAAQTINRIIDVFPSHQQSQVRAQLSFVLEGVLCQNLLPRANGPGRAMALEVMVPNAAIRNLIREDKVHQIYSSMQVGQERFEMETMNQSLHDLCRKRMVSQEDALGRSPDPAELRKMLGMVGVGAESTQRGPQAA